MQSSYSLGSSKGLIWKERLRNQAKVTQDHRIRWASFPKGRITGTFLYFSFFCLQPGPELPRTKVRTGLLCLSFAAGHHGPSCVGSIEVIPLWSMKLVNVMGCVSIPCHWKCFFQHHWTCMQYDRYFPTSTHSSEHSPTKTKRITLPFFYIHIA